MRVGSRPGWPFAGASLLLLGGCGVLVALLPLARAGGGEGEAPAQPAASADEVARLRAELEAARTELVRAKSELAALRRERAADREVVARVGERELTRRELAEACLRTYGRSFFETFINRAVVQEEARRLGVSVSEADRAAWVERELERYRAAAPSEEAFLAGLARDGLTLEGFRAILAANAAEATLIIELARRARVSDEGVRREWERRHGERIELRHILYRVAADAKPAAVETARENAARALRKVGMGADFAKLAEAESEDAASAARGGELGKLSRSALAEAFPGLAEAAFAHPGEGLLPEPVRSEAGLHLVQVLGREPAGRPLEEVADEIRAELSRTEPTPEQTSAYLRELRRRYPVERRFP